jgi:hypothetical protein
MVNDWYIKYNTLELESETEMQPLKEWISSKYYIKIQSVPHRKHITSPLQRPTG